jgi:hypothetical protein
MAVATKDTTHVRIKWITEKKAKSILDDCAKRVLKISGDEFVSRWKSGQFRQMDSTDCPGVIELALLVPPTKKSSARKKQTRGNR